MKKLTSFIILLFITLTPFVFADARIYEDVDSETLNEATDILSEMGIITGYDDDTFRGSDNITRAEFAVVIARMRKMNEASEREHTYFYDVPASHWAAGAINQLAQAGVINGYDDGTFGVDNNITVQEAYKIILSMLGYTTVAEAEGGYPEGYIKNASYSGLNDNLPLNSSDKLTRGQAAMLIYNALDISLLTQNSQGKLEKSDTTFARQYWHIMKKQGTVTEVPGTGFYSANGFRQVIGIDDMQHETSLDIPLDLLGKYVVAYYDDTANDEVLYIHEKKTRTKEFIINAADIDDVSESGVIRYYSGTNAKKTEKIDPKAYVIYNGIAKREYKFSDFDIDYGTIRFLKTDGSGSYNIVFIDEYYDMYVTSIAADKYTIYGSRGDNIKIEDSDFDKLVIKDTNNKSLEFSDIAIEDVLSIKVSGTDYAEIIVCRNVIEGNIGTISEDDVDIDGDIYDLYKPYTSIFKTDFKSGNIITAYLDVQEHLVYAKAAGRKEPIGYLVRCWIDESGEDLFLKIFTYDGVMDTVKVASRVNIDGESLNSSKKAFSALSGNSYPFERQMIVYKTNGQGEINYIDTVKRGVNEGDNTLTVSMPLAAYRCKENGVLGGKGYVKNTTNMICVPEDEDVEKSSDSDYSIRPMSSILTNVYRNLETYSLSSKIGYESIVLMKGGKSNGISETDQCVIVKKILESITDKGEITKLIRYVSPSGEFEKLVDPDALLKVSTMQKGDILRLGVNSDDMIDTVEYVVRNGIKPTMGIGYFYDSLNSVDVEVKYTYGYAAEKEESLLRISYDDTDGRDEVANITSCIIYNRDNGDITYGNINDILTKDNVGDECDEIFIQWHYSDIYCCVVYR